MENGKLPGLPHPSVGSIFHSSDTSFYGIEDVGKNSLAGWDQHLGDTQLSGIAVFELFDQYAITFLLLSLL